MEAHTCNGSHLALLEPAASHRPTVPVATTPLQILLVEDMPADILLMRKALAAAEILYELDTMQHGNRLVSMLCATHRSGADLPDLLLLDLGLPGTHGFDLLEQLADAPLAVRSIPLVILTGFSDFAYLKETTKLNILDYLNKPLPAIKLQSLLRKAESFRTCT